MDSLLITNKGIEDVAALEIKELIGKKASTDPYVVKFKCKIEELCKVSYKSQTARRVLMLIAEFDASEKLEQTVKKIKPHIKNLDKWLNKESTFVVKCKRIGKHNYKSSDLAGEIGKAICKKTKSEKGYEPKVNLKNPDVIFYLFLVEKKAYFGVDFSGFDLGKRDYKVLTYTPSLKPNLAYVILKLANYSADKTVADPFTSSGIVPIEAALYASGKSPNFYQKSKLLFSKNLKKPENFFKKLDAPNKKNKEIADIHCLADQFRHIKAAKANSKIAGVNKLINFSKFEVEWLDTKFEKQSIDIIASNAPRSSKHNQERVNKLYDELFYQANYILKPNGVVALISNKIETIQTNAEKHGFKIMHSRSIWQGEEELKIIIIKK